MSIPNQVTAEDYASRPDFSPECKDDVKQTYDWCVEVAKAHGSDFWQLLWSRLRRHYPKSKFGESVKKMSDKESRAFGEETMPFGEFKGMSIDTVPKNRLRWYADQDFIDRLRLYLESDRVRREDD